MEPSFFLMAAAIGLALLFDFSNGFHDSANQVATVISSRALAPEIALPVAALAEFGGAYFLGTRVAQTIGRDIIDPALLPLAAPGLVVLLSALAGALCWNGITWYFGIPSSSSHALLGGLVGAFAVGFGTGAVNWNKVLKIFGVMLLSPLAGFFLSYLATKLTFFFSEGFGPRLNQTFKSLQFLSLVGQSLAHGTNDAQKTMGVIALILALCGRIQIGSEFAIPVWVVAACASVMALGVLFGGWRIIRKLGMGLYKVRPIHAFASQTSAASIMYAASWFGFPISTTQVMSSSVMGAGAAFRVKSVRWTVVGDMVFAWMVTIPACALFSGIGYKLARQAWRVFSHVALP